ncbi:MAG: NAD(P)/FAD-dependent oxidoreductase [Methanogenium sp.]|nr:NAD(P)/FAD-dependent oxidoreductase [Methanogenium sp.]
MNVCVIGGGLTGLSAAYYLSDYTCVDLIEKEAHTGGCLSSLPAKTGFVESFYHHCFAGDKQLFSLMDVLGITDELKWLKGSTGYYVDGVIHPLTTMPEIIRYPDLTFIDKARLGLLTLRSKSYDVEALDDISARDFIVDTCGMHNYSSFFEPLLKSKFGEMGDLVSAAWLISRIAIRSDRGSKGEHLGYMKNGWHSLIDGLKSALINKGCTITCNSPARELRYADGRWSVNGTVYDAVISTINPAHLSMIGGPVVADIPYQGAACMTIGLEREVTDGIYWLNMKDDAPYGAVIGHTNFVSEEMYGEHIVYLASYFRGTLPDNQESVMLSDFKKRFSVSDNEIHWHHLTVEPSAGPVYTTGFKKLIPDYSQNGMFIAGMFSRPNYPERSMEGSVIAGKQVAEMVRETIFNE